MTDEPMSTADVLQWITDAKFAITNAEQDLACAIAIARHENTLSWQANADALGVSRQAAWERFGRLEPSGWERLPKARPLDSRP